VDATELVPQHKSDLERANAAVAAGSPAVEPVLGDLLTWLQDMNWPVARTLAPFLATIGLPLVPHVRAALDGDDLVWKYWIVSSLLRVSRPLAGAFRADIERFAYSPTESEAAEELDAVAREVLESWSW
jgi:Domain of unknown function (DUF5071)